MFDLKKIENFLGEIKSFMANQKKDKELELLVNTAATLQGIAGINPNLELEAKIDLSLNLAENLILKAKKKVGV